MATKKAAPVAPATRGKATPTLKGRIGPDLSTGYLNPEREGKVLDAIRNGLGGGTVRGIVAATGLRTPTVTYFAKEALPGGSAKSPLVDIVSVSGARFLVPLSTDRKAGANGRKLRADLLRAKATAEKGTAPKSKRAARPKREKAAPAAEAAPVGAEEGAE